MPIISINYYMNQKSFSRQFNSKLSLCDFLIKNRNVKISVIQEPSSAATKALVSVIPMYVDTGIKRYLSSLVLELSLSPESCREQGLSGQLRS